MFCLINNELLIKMKEFYNCCMYNYIIFLIKIYLLNYHFINFQKREIKNMSEKRRN